jgi:glycosyltransferase involved in cell wall biosynthesis
MTLVSIITPSFNQAAFLRQTLNSVLQQDYHDLEYLVVDGGSRDGSVDILRESAPRLAWWVSEPDAGQADAINKALAHARGDVVAWLNSDDYYLPGTVRAAARVFEVLVYGNRLAVDDANRITNILTYQQVSLEDLMCFGIIGQPAAFIRRSALEEVGGLDASLHMLLDHQLWIRLATVGRIVHVDETWAAARYHPRAKNRASSRDFGREAFRILEWMSKEPSLAPVFPDVRNRARASAHRLDARYLVDGGLPLEALKAWLRAFLLHPPTALARLNLLGSALLELAGLKSIRRRVLQRRQDRLAR